MEPWSDLCGTLDTRGGGWVGLGAPAMEDYCDCNSVLFSERAQKMDPMYLLSVFMRDQRSILLLVICCIHVFLSIFEFLEYIIIVRFVCQGPFSG